MQWDGCACACACACGWEEGRGGALVMGVSLADCYCVAACATSSTPCMYNCMYECGGMDVCR